GGGSLAFNQAPMTSPPLDRIQTPLAFKPFQHSSLAWSMPRGTSAISLWSQAQPICLVRRQPRSSPHFEFIRREGHPEGRLVFPPQFFGADDDQLTGMTMYTWAFGGVYDGGNMIGSGFPLQRESSPCGRRCDRASGVPD